MAVGFEAGNEFGQAAPETPAPAAAAPQPAPQAEAEPQEQTEVDGTDSWADPDPDTEATESVADVPAPTASELEITGPGGSTKFKLDPNDPTLKRALSLGLGARKWQAERDQARTEAKRLREEQTSLREKARIWDKLDELAQLGQRSRVASAVLGDEGYKALRDEIIKEYEVMNGGDPDARNAYERERATRDSEFTKHMYEQKLKETESRLQEREDQVEQDRLRSLGTQALSKYDFRNFIADKDLAAKQNKMLWKSAWVELEELSETQELSPELVRKVFAETAQVMRAGMKRTVDAKVNQVIEKKKQTAKEKVQAAATERYPTGNAPDISKWDPKTGAKGLLKTLVGNK